MAASTTTSQLGWIDPLFIPLVLAGPPITGAVPAYRGVSYTWVAALWASTGLGMVGADGVINRLDVLLHLSLAVLVPLLTGIGFGAVRLTQRGPSPAT